jgi:signal transduction histidine kinase
LSAIKGLSEEISESYDDMEREEVIDYAVHIRKASHKMFQLITNLLDVNAIESGKINADFQQQNILPIITAVFNTYAARAANKGIQATLTHEKSIYEAFVDENLVHQILDNLISNAVKYSPKESAFNVTVSQVNDHTGQWIRCEICDQGLGLSEADQDKLFGKFTRLTPQPTGDEHSTGLGLFIVKKLVLALNGQVWCKSELGEGACFIVQWPCQEDVDSMVIM